jgi:hypothetical protein
MITNIIEIAHGDNFIVHSLMLLLFEGFNNLNFNKNKKETFLNFINEDNFTEETKKREFNQSLLSKLEKIKFEATCFMKKTNATIDNKFIDVTGTEVELKTENILSAFENYELQISRLRLVIQPEINITRIVHTTSKICYLSARGYWYVDFREKKRVFTKNFGKESDYELKKDDPKAIEDAIREIQTLCLNEYNSMYP